MDFVSSAKQPMRIGLVATGGGHLREMIALRAVFERHDHFLISSPESRASSEIGVFARHYFIWNTGAGRWKTRPFRFTLDFFQNLASFYRIFLLEHPRCIISTGSGIAVPGFIIAKILGIRTVYVESYARVHSLSLTGRLCYLLSDLFVVQHRSLVHKFRRAVYAGSLYDYLPETL